jgi:DNA-binding transcriptional MocR family regulator
MRLNFSNQSEDRILEGMLRLSQVVRGYLRKKYGARSHREES